MEKQILETVLLNRERSDFGGTARYGGSDFPCSIGALEDSRRFGAGGYEPGKDTIIVIRKSAAGTVTFKPQVPIDRTDRNGKLYKLKVITVNDGIYFWQLTCNDRRKT